MKRERKLVSVIVAAYNIEAYLPRCLDSLLAQEYKDLEIIVVDDGSQDGTGEICDSYVAKDGRVKAIHQENSGLSGARNAGLEIAKGDYIGYVDGDDWIEPEMYGTMIKACEENNAEMAICAYREIGNGNEAASFSGQEYVLGREEALDIYICDNRPFHIYNSVWSKLFSRTLVEDLRFPVGKKSEDIIYTTKAMIRMSSCVFLDNPYYNYVTGRADSIMNIGLKERRFHDEIPFWREQTECLREAGLSELSEKAAYYFYRRLLFYYVDFMDRKMKDAGMETAKLLQGEKSEIRRLYRKGFAAAGDRVRMRLVLFWPGAYYRIVKIYDKFIVPLRG